MHLPLQASIIIPHRPAIHGRRYFLYLVFSSTYTLTLTLPTYSQTPTPYGNSHTGVLDTPYEHDLGSVTGLTSSSHSSVISGEGPKPNTPEGKSRRFPKFKFSLTAAPPKPKPKQPGQPRVVSCPLVYVVGCHQHHTYCSPWHPDTPLFFLARRWPRRRRKY